MRIRHCDGTRYEEDPALEWSGEFGAPLLRSRAFPDWYNLSHMFFGVFKEWAGVSGVEIKKRRGLGDYVKYIYSNKAIIHAAYEASGRVEKLCHNEMLAHVVHGMGECQKKTTMIHKSLVGVCAERMNARFGYLVGGGQLRFRLPPSDPIIYLVSIKDDVVKVGRSDTGETRPFSAYGPDAKVLGIIHVSDSIKAEGDLIRAFGRNCIRRRETEFFSGRVRGIYLNLFKEVGAQHSRYTKTGLEEVELKLAAAEAKLAAAEARAVAAESKLAESDARVETLDEGLMGLIELICV
jgi:hypothetical protein